MRINMTIDVLMPNLGFDTQSGRLIEWLKHPGDSVSKGQPIAVIESDKANVELEAVASGMLVEHLAAAGMEITVGSVIARIGSADDLNVSAPESTSIADSSLAQRVSPVAQRIARQQQIDPQQVTGSGGRGRVMRRDIEAHRQQQTIPASATNGNRVLALPRVRHAARQQGIDLQAVLDAGYPNPISLQSLTAFMTSRPNRTSTPAALQEGVTRLPLSRMRQTIARRLSDSMREAPHFYVTGEFVFDAALERLKHVSASLRINDLLVYLVTQTLLRVPRLNATFVDDAVLQYETVNLAVAVTREDGLLTPVLRDAGRFSLPGLATELRSLIDRTRSNHLTPEDMQGGTFTISNMGMVRQVDHFTAVINPPQVGILAVGALKPRPVVIDGGLFIRQTVHLTLSGDHRAVDGMDLAQFMTVFEEELTRFSG
jgi:pyruvate dehydrogenase E2 component (dihydrolipoamide acetyltransferase)